MLGNDHGWTRLDYMYEYRPDFVITVYSANNVDLVGTEDYDRCEL